MIPLANRAALRAEIEAVASRSERRQRRSRPSAFRDRLVVAAFEEIPFESGERLPQRIERGDMGTAGLWTGRGVAPPLGCSAS